MKRGNRGSSFRLEKRENFYLDSKGLAVGSLGEFSFKLGKL